MRALCLIAVKPGKVDAVVQVLKKKRKIVKDVMVVTGRADIGAIMRGSMDLSNRKPNGLTLEISIPLTQNEQP